MNIRWSTAISTVLLSAALCPSAILLKSAERWVNNGVSRLLDRRELGVINIGGAGAIIVDGQRHDIGHRDALYIGKGAKELVFVSNEASRPAKFYYNSAPAHTAYPTKKCRLPTLRPSP